MRIVVFVYLIIINMVGVSIMYIDKQRAIKHKWRIPEKTLFLIAIVGGSIGTWCGMYLFRHKTKHVKFVIGFPLILIIQIIIVLYFLNLA